MSINDNSSEKKPLLTSSKDNQQKKEKEKDQNKNQTTTTTTQQTKEELTQQTYDTLHYLIDEKYFHIFEPNKLNCHGCRPHKDTYCRRVRKCPRCNGQGDSYHIKGDSNSGSRSTVIICPTCNGIGRVRCVFCVVCKECKNGGCYLCSSRTGFKKNVMPSLYN